MLLFTAEDLRLLVQKNIGLRLSCDLQEVVKGGCGDAVPLSPLAGAYDILKFIHLSQLPELPRQVMQAIYKKYSISTIPRIMLYYAAQHDISDAKKQLLLKKNDHEIQADMPFEVVAIQAEVSAKIEIINVYLDLFDSDIVLPSLLADIIQHLPHLAAELVYHFNEQFQSRLTENWYAYAEQKQMAYLFLSDGAKERTYHKCYDESLYPLGKVGVHEFKASSVVDVIEFSGGEDRHPASKEELERRIVASLKKQLYSPSSVDAPNKKPLVKPASLEEYIMAHMQFRSLISILLQTSMILLVGMTVNMFIRLSNTFDFTEDANSSDAAPSL